MPLIRSGQESDDPVTLELLKEKAARAVQRRDVETAIFVIEQTGEIGTVEAARLALRIVEKMKFSSGVPAAAERTISQMTSPDVREFVLREARGSMDWRLRVILLGVVAPLQGEEAFKVLLAALGEKEDVFRAAAAQGLGRRGDRRAVEPLIELMFTLDKKKGLVWEHCQAALVRLTGQDLEMGADFKTWWDAHGKKTEPPPKVTPKTEGEPEEPRPPLVKGGVERLPQDREATFFGVRITCQQIVFIIDVSGSMEKKDPPPPEDRRTGTGNRPPPEPGENRRRIIRAQKELSRTLRSLDSSVEFNVIAFSDEIVVWSKKGLRKATKDGKEKAVKFVERFEAAGTTWTDSALEAAYQLNDDAYCFYLLSDGTPTHEGGEEPGDTEAIMEDIYQMVPELDIYRRVRIHTLGFRGANVPFMEQLAEMTGGSFTEIR